MKNRRMKDFPTAACAVAKEKGLRAPELRRLSGVKHNTLYKALRGDDLSLGTAVRMAGALGVSVHSLVANDISAALREARAGTARAIRPEQPGSEQRSGLQALMAAQDLLPGELAERSGVGICVIKSVLEHNAGEYTRCSDLLGLAETLGTTVDDLITLRDAAELGDDACPLRPVGPVNKPENPIDCYRVSKRLSYRKLCLRLGVSPFGAQKICRRSTDLDRYIDRLCAYDGCTRQEFLARYGRQAA